MVLLLGMQVTRSTAGPKRGLHTAAPKRGLHTAEPDRGLVAFAHSRAGHSAQGAVNWDHTSLRVRFGLTGPPNGCSFLS